MFGSVEDICGANWRSQQIMRFVRCGLRALLVVTMTASVGVAQQAAVPGANQTAKRPPDFARFDAAKLPISHKIHTGGDPDWLAIGLGSVWVAVPKTNEVVRINPTRNVVQARVAVDKEPCYGIGIGGEHVWVLNCQSRTLTRITPRTNKVDLRVPVVIDPAGEGMIAADQNNVWFVGNEDGHASTLIQMNARGHTVRKVVVGKDSAVVKQGFGSIWVVSSGEGKVYRVDLRQGKVVATVSVAAGPRFATVAAGAVWVLSQSDGSVSRIDPRTNKVTAVVQAQVPGAGGEISFGGGFLWVTMSGTPVTRIDPVKNKVVDQYDNYPKADAIRFGFGSVWVSDHGKGDVWRIDPRKMRVR